MRVFRSREYFQRGAAGVIRHPDNAEIYPYDQYYDRGEGIGSIFRSLYSTMVPLVKSVFRIGKKALRTPVGQAVKKAAKRTAMKAGLQVVDDALQGRNVLKAAKTELKRTPGRFVQELKKDLPKKRGKRGRKTTLSVAKRGGNAAYVKRLTAKQYKKKKKKKKGKKKKQVAVSSAALKQFIRQIGKRASKKGRTISKKKKGKGKRKGKKKGSSTGKRGNRAKLDLFD